MRVGLHPETTPKYGRTQDRPWMVEGVIKGGVWRTLRDVFCDHPMAFAYHFLLRQCQAISGFEYLFDLRQSSMSTIRYLVPRFLLCVLFFLDVSFDGLLPLLWLCRSGLVGGTAPGPVTPSLPTVPAMRVAQPRCGQPTSPPGSNGDSRNKFY